MSVLVGIVSKNRENILPAAIDSALAQNYSPLSVAVFDDNSTDNTRELASGYPNVNWEFSKEDKGYLYARNRFMQTTQADYFCSLDDDSWFLETNTLTEAIDYLEKNPGIAAIAFDILTPERPKGWPVSEPFEVANFIGCGHVLRLSAVREVGYYDPNPLYYGGEEKDLCIKFIDKDYRIAFMPGRMVWHDKTNVARDLQGQHVSGVCNDLVFAYRRLPFLYLLPGLPFKIMAHIRFGIRYGNGMFFRSALKGIGKFLALMFTFALTRKPVRRSSFLKYRSLISKKVD